MLTIAQKSRYTAPALEKNSARFSSLRFKADSRHQRGFFVSVKSLLWVGLAGHLRMRRFLERGLLTCKRLPALLAEGSKFQKTCSRRQNMSSISIGTSEIRCINGLYSLNDLHKASGNLPKHRPGYFLASDQTNALMNEIQTAGIPAVKTHEGRNGGTFACRELVIAYAAWISPAFHLKVIRAFLDSIEPQQPDIFQNSAHSSFFPVVNMEIEQHIPLAKIKKALRSIFVFALKHGSDFSNQMLFLFSITTQLETLFSGAKYIPLAKFKEFNEKLKKREIDISFLVEE